MSGLGSEMGRPPDVVRWITTPTYREARTSRVWTALVWLVGLWLAAAIGLDAYGLRVLRADETWDAVVVAGCRVLPDGSPSEGLMRRTRQAAELWRTGVVPVILLTGGVGEYPPSEAEAAAAYARQLGVPDEALILETVSRSTEENARLAKALFPVRAVIVCTDTYHVFRCERVFGRYFPVVQALGTPPPFWARLQGALREVPAVITYAVTGRL